MSPNETKTLSADTIVVSARVDSFHDVFVAEQAWYPVRIDDRRKSALKWICVYQIQPVQAITHYARIVCISDHFDTGRYRIVFDGITALPSPVSIGQESGLTMQGQKYTNLERLLVAKSISDLKPWNKNATN